MTKNSDKLNDLLSKAAKGLHFGRTMAEIGSPRDAASPPSVAPAKLSPEQHAQVKDLFQRVHALSNSERNAIVLREPGIDDTVRSEVFSLLEFHDAPPKGRTKGEIHDLLRGQPRSFGSLSTRAGRARLRRVALAACLVFVSASLVIAAVWADNRLKQILHGSVGNQIEAIRDIGAQAVTLWAESRLQMVDRLAKDPIFRPAALNLLDRAIPLRSDPKQWMSSKPAEDMLKVFAPVAKSAGAFGYVILDPSNRIIASNLPQLVDARMAASSPANSYMFDLLRGDSPRFGGPRLFGSNMDLTIAEPKQIVAYGATIADDAGMPRGVLAFGEELEANLSKLLRSGRLGTSGETYAFDAAGVMVTRSRFDDAVTGALGEADAKLFKVLGGIPLRDPGGDILDGHRISDFWDTLPLTQIAAKATAAARAGPVTAGVITQPYRDYRGVPVVGAWQWFPKYNFGIATEIDADEAFQPLRLLGFIFTSVVLAVIFVAIGWAAVSLALYRTRKKYRTERVGSYHLVRKIADGGIGTVYLAHHDQLRRPTAVKILKDLRPSPSALARFEEEAKQVCRLSHPNTVQIYDFGVSEDGRMFIAMEYLRGINLSELLLVEGSVVYPRAVHIVRQVAASLDEAHALGLIHRDIKPLNVMLCRIGGSFDHVKVLDFGLVKQIGEDAGLKGDGATRNIQGTPLYMAPERLRKGAPVDQRSDIYSLGVLLYVLLSGRSPFSSEDELAVIQEILQGHTQPLRAASQQIPPELKLLTMRCLSIDPELRPQSAVEVIRELDGMDMPPWTPAMASAWWEGKPALLASADILPSSRQ
jgi:hypothetical protein